jgi:hypothetical protein
VKGFELLNFGQSVLKVDYSGLTINGTVNATSGKLAGFNISSNDLVLSRGLDDVPWPAMFLSTGKNETLWPDIDAYSVGSSGSKSDWFLWSGGS